MSQAAKSYQSCIHMILCCLLFFAATLAQAQVRPFNKAYQTNAPGDILIIGNTITTCRDTAPTGAAVDMVTAAGQCAAGRNAASTSVNPSANNASHNNNNAHILVNVDVDPLAPGLNSSTAGLQIPIGATVLWAGLYWGSNAAAATARNQISFKTPSGNYQTVTADWIATTLTTNYHAGKTVTSLITASGDYTVADIKQTVSTTGYGVGYGGWSLVVVYQLNTEQFRNLTVFDGYQVIDGGTTLPIRLDGFLTPPLGPVGAKVGIVAYEGDFGSTGDRALLNGTQLSNTLNPGTNLFNSSITREGVRITDKTPDYINQLGFDIDVFSTSGTLPTNATVTTVTLSSTGETYYPGVITTAIDIFVPNLAASLTKTVADLNGGVVDPGDILEYTISFKNTGQDIATKVFVIDPIPAGTTFFAGSLKVASGANIGPKTDAADPDQAEFDSAQNRVVFRLGSGASSTNGGSFSPGQSSTITFQVKVNPGTNGQTISNIATINYTGTTLPTTYTAIASAAITVVSLASTPVLSHQKTVQVLSDPVNGTTNPKNIPGAVNLYTLTIQNTGSGTANSLTIADLISTNSELFTGNFSTVTGVLSPFFFTNGATPSGVGCGFVAIGDATDCVEFSNNSGTSWVYTPNGAFDPAVTNIRFKLTGTMNGAAAVGTPPYPSFTLQFKTRIK